MKVSAGVVGAGVVSLGPVRLGVGLGVAGCGVGAAVVEALSHSCGKYTGQVPDTFIPQ